MRRYSQNILHWRRTEKKHQFYPLEATKYTTKTKLVNNFDQQMMCESPVLWSKYMTKNKAGKAVCDKNNKK